MATYTSRLFTRPKLERMAEVADSISNECDTISDALANYEGADDLSGEEATQEREDAREEAWAAMGNVIAEAQRLAELREDLLGDEG